MIKSKNLRFAPFIMLICLMFMIGFTFAWIGFSSEKNVRLSFLKVALDVVADTYDESQELSEGEIIVNSVSFSPNASTSECYVRAKLHYDTENAPSDDDKRFLTAINYQDIVTTTTATYRWSKQEDGYYYLVGTDGQPLVVDSQDGTFSFCQNVTYDGAKYLYGTISTPTDLVLDIKVQAIQAKNIPSTGFEGLLLAFEESFGEEIKYGSIVVFDTGEGTTIMSQTFLTETDTVASVEDPTLDGYRFKGWYTDPSYNNEFDFSTVITKNVTLYAYFEEIIIPYKFGVFDSGHSYSGRYYIEMGYFPMTRCDATDAITKVDGKTFSMQDGEYEVYTDGVDEYITYESWYYGLKYYKFEPIKWVIIGYDEEYDTDLLFSVFSVVDGVPYVDKNKTKQYTGVDQPPLVVLSELILENVSNSDLYKDSSIYTACQSLYQSFTDEAKQYIKSVTLTNTDDSNSSVETTQDQYVFALSYNNGDFQTTNNYGYYTYDMDYVSMAQPTNFASDTGVADSTNSGGRWILRTGDSWDTYYINYGGSIDYGEDELYDKGVRPSFVFQFPQE